LTEVEATKCTGVRTINFEAERFKNWRDPGTINGFPGLSLSLWNNTRPDTSAITTPFNDTFFDYWTGSSWQVNRVATLSAYATTAVPADNIAEQTCGTGWNCSYAISFTAPGYKCEQIAHGRGDKTAELRAMKAPFHTGDLLPDGDFSYFAHTTLGEYSLIQIDAHPGGIPKEGPPFPPNLGAFRTDPVLWIGYSEATNLNATPPTDRTSPVWDSSFTPKIFRCEHYVTKYTAEFNHTFSEQSARMVKKDYLYPVINTTYVPGVDANDGTMDNVTATPESGYVMPLNTELYRLVSSYYSLGLQMRGHINGTIQYTPYPLPNTEIMRTSLINKATHLPVPDFQREIERFYENIVLSLLSNPQFVVVAWAADPNTRTGIANQSTIKDPKYEYPCIKTRTINAYVYNARDLWLVYAFAVVSAVASVVLGALALAENNFFVRNTRMSSIVAATRSQALDEMPWTASQWGDIPQEIRERKMGYGLVIESSPGESRKVSYGFAPIENIHREPERSETMFTTNFKRNSSSSLNPFRRRGKQSPLP
jgi:hypothetical protein